MTSLRSATAMRRAACRRPSLSQLQPTTLLYRRGLVSHRDKKTPYEKREIAGDGKHGHFNIGGKVYVVTGGGQGLGFSIAEGLVEAGGTVHVLDRSPEPTKEFEDARNRMDFEFDGALEYHQADVSDEKALGRIIPEIAARKKRLDGLVAAAAIQQVTKAIDYKQTDIAKMMSVNYTGVFLAAQACAREMLNYKSEGSMCLVASMSGTIANRGLHAPVYNSSKAAVIQLARNLAMEWGRKRPDGSGGIRVNSLSPGHIVTPMVQENFRRGESNRSEWEDNNMLGRISMPEEYKSVALFMLSGASSYMTGHDLRIDGGTTAW
ncbi:NAD(P)-binding protein [Didymella exigua CBS 183.55]|uniref:NAD(P)-binding protein n=1 Tax=Didymella exigua CBS 183.55 TaxID=1150837 RepID=A0A6A5RSJ9_9PLEO|nr:NAD(P)-binding protein [Didymella exigua CBS 183.55]KAF1931375.1 NAD(P)-binding protein [Didymella exigua CBS 183.55]